MKKKQGGFTLVELLVVVAIISVLAAIAIPQFKLYRSRSFDAGARADLRNAALAEEAFFVDNDTYRSCTDSECEILLPGMRQMTAGVQLVMTGTASGFAGRAVHVSGTTVFNWNSSSGGFE